MTQEYNGQLTFSAQQHLRGINFFCKNLENSIYNQFFAYHYIINELQVFRRNIHHNKVKYESTIDT